MTNLKPLHILALLIAIVAILTACSASKKISIDELVSKDADKYVLTKATVTTFENTYNDNNLLKRSRTYISDSLEGGKGKFVSDIFFFYDDRNKLVESKTYDKDPIPDESALSVVSLFSDSLDQTFCFIGYPGDTTMYMWTKKNDKGLITEDFLSTNLIRDYQGYLKEYAYNSKGERTQMKETDLLTNDTMQVEYRYLTKGDTLLTETYRNNERMGGIIKAFKQGKAEVTLTYFPQTNDISYISYKTKNQLKAIGFMSRSKNVVTSFLDRFGNKTKTIDETYELKE